MNFYAFHIGDYAVHTRHLSLMEDLAYRRLLDWYYIHERAIPAETQSVARLIGMREHVAEIDAVLSEFFTPNEAGEWTHSRCDAEIAKARAHAERARNNGKKGGRPSEKPGAEPGPAPAPKPRPKGGTQSVTAGGPEESDSKAPNPIPIPNKKNPLTPKGVVGGAFARFWAAWPSSKRKVNQHGCWTRWRTQNLDALADAILAHVEAMKRSEDWLKDGGQFIPLPITYLNQRRWEAPTDQQAAAATAAANWRDSGAGIIAKGIELGVGPWSEQLQMEGKAPDFLAYRAKVERAVKAREAEGLPA